MKFTNDQKYILKDIIFEILFIGKITNDVIRQAILYKMRVYKPLYYFIDIIANANLSSPEQVAHEAAESMFLELLSKKEIDPISMELNRLEDLGKTLQDMMALEDWSKEQAKKRIEIEYANSYGVKK